MNKIFILLNFLIVFDFSNSSCERYENGCLKCNPLTDLCFRCENDVLKPDGNGGCIGTKKCKLGDNFCFLCNKEENLCETCEESFYPDNNGGCSYTDNCEISYKGDCIKCKENYVLVGIREYYDTLKICKPLSSSDLNNCEKVDIIDGTCSKCKNGYNITKGDKKCTSTENCYEMENGECSSCEEDYYLDKNQKKCILIEEKKFYNCRISLDGENCQKCKENYFLSDDLICVSTNYCSKSEKNECTECKDGFYLTKNNKCARTDNCKEVDPKNGICIKCINNYYLDIKNRQCIPYSKNEDLNYCAKYNDSCFQCIEGYYLSHNELCSASKNCTLAEKGNCIKCDEGLYLTKDFICNDEEHCTYTNEKRECIECEDNYYYDIFSKICKIVESDNFKNCKYSDYLGENCAFCKAGYYINQLDHLCYSNTEKGKFYKCISSKTGQNCTQCEKGFYLGYGDYQCSNIEGCFKSNENNECLECEEDYCFNQKTGKCEWNYLIEEESQKIFFKCKKTNKDATACISCEDRFEVGNEGVCVDTLDCDEMIDGKCVKCRNLDEEGNYHCLNKLYGCVETYDSNCTRCDDNLDVLTHCDECEEGYELDEYFSCVLIEKEE